MPKQSDYLTGWIDTSIHDFLREIDHPTSSMAYALITCLDSETRVSSLLQSSKHLKNLVSKCQSVGDGVLLTTRQLLAADKTERLFFGFDEVWFFPEATVTPKPSGLAIVGPERIASADIDRHEDWLRSNKCSLGIGDGVGLNFCLKVRGVARYIVDALNDSNPRAAVANFPTA